MTAYVHGSTDDRETARLEKQADLTASMTFAQLPFKPGMHVLDLATGVGAMGARLTKRFPGVRITGLDLSKTQLQAARRGHPDLRLIRADATRLPFPDATFDGVHCSWLLEHVPSPVAVLRDVKRVMKPGATAHFIEVDNATFSFQPANAAVTEILKRLNEAQLAAGGNPYVGRQAETLFRDAGFTKVTVERTPFVGSSADPVFFRAFIEEFAEIFEGLDESLGADAVTLITTASQALRGALNTPGTSLTYAPVRIHAVA